jgi:hypothetical protein
MGTGCVVAAVSWWLFRDHYRVAVLGARYSGKTTLIHYWRGLPAPAVNTRTTGREPSVNHVKLEIRVDGDKVTFDDVSDITGNESALGLWADYVRDRHVVYLLDARVLCGCLDWTDWRKDLGGHVDRRGPDRLHADMGQIHRMGRDDIRVPTRSRALVITHTDEDCRRNGTGVSDQDYLTAVEHDVLAHRARLGGVDQVALIVAPGAIGEPAVAARVTESLVRHFNAWESRHP